MGRPIAGPSVEDDDPVAFVRIFEVSRIDPAAVRSDARVAPGIVLEATGDVDRRAGRHPGDDGVLLSGA
ncbi:MAG TPA: hypothetical protein VE007_01435, partial [Thermoanaerobaculia bacterium]|nr:hypothetical protein [Thermoanaerobaculia bacterium]